MKKLRAFGYVLKNSLTNLSYYGEVKNTSFWFLLKYLYLLFVLTSIISLLPLIVRLLIISPNLQNEVSRAKAAVLEAYPKDLVVNIANGQLSTNVPQPYYYKNYFVIDTNATAEDYSTYKTKVPVLITKTVVVYPKDSSGATEIFFLNQLQDNVSLDYNSYQAGISKLDPYLKYVTPIFWIVLLLLITLVPLIFASSALSWSLLSLLFLALIIFLGAKLFKGNFSFWQTYKMTLMASTLPTLFFTLLSLFNLTPAIPFGYSLILGLFMTAVLHQLWKKNS